MSSPTDAITLAAPTSIASELPAWLDRDLYPFTPKQFRTDAGSISYVDQGRGRTVVLSHGTPSWSFEWRNVIRELAKTHRVIAPDHLGFGLSHKPYDSSILHPRDHAERLASMLDALDVRDAVMVGHDFGGPIGVGALLKQRGRFTGLVLTNTWLWSLADRADVRRLSGLVGSWFGKLLYLGLNASPRWILPSAFGDRRLLTKPIHRHYLAPLDSWQTRIAPWKLGVELAGSGPFYDELWGQRAELSKLDTAIVWGEADPTFRQAELDRLREALPSASVQRLSGVGHFTAEEAPDAIARAVRSIAVEPLQR